MTAWWLPNYKLKIVAIKKNVGAQFTYLHVPSLCKKFFVMRHIIGHSNIVKVRQKMGKGFLSKSNWKNHDQTYQSMKVKSPFSDLFS